MLIVGRAIASARVCGTAASGCWALIEVESVEYVEVVLFYFEDVVYLFGASVDVDRVFRVVRYLAVDDELMEKKVELRRDYPVLVRYAILLNFKRRTHFSIHFRRSQCVALVAKF